MAEKKTFWDYLTSGASAVKSASNAVSSAISKANKSTPTYTVPDLSNKQYSSIDLSKYASGYKPSEGVNLVGKQSAEAEAALKNYGNFNYNRQGAYDQAMDAILNRKGFSYDLNGDALYQQYKDNYITQGKQAMMDAAGQAAAMTGGYGNSYAQTVGQQTYQGYLQGLNDKIPELYQMALDRYNSEGDRLATNYGLLSSDRANALAEHESGYNKLVADRDYYGTKYNNERAFDYGTWNDNRTYDTSQYWNETNFGYGQEQGKIANEMAAAQLNETIRANKQSEYYQGEQLKLAQNQPAEVEYAINTYSEVPESIHKKLESIVSDTVKRVREAEKWNKNNNSFNPFNPTAGTKVTNMEEVEEALGNYLDALTASGEVSEKVATALYSHYLSSIK